MKNLPRSTFVLCLVLSGFFMSSAAQAAGVVEVSLGKGFTLKPDRDATSTNIMVAPGFGIGEVVRLELGILTEFGDGNGDFDFQFRPMLVLDPPILPLYGRLIVAIIEILNETEIAYGGAIGIGGSLGGVGVFGEIGILPVGEAHIIIAEGRAGVFFSF
ncbi:MAG: hypothetical protein R3C68_17950 [Myxococcota bacterium]